MGHSSKPAKDKRFWKDLSDFIGAHRGDSCIVCGLGPSIDQLTEDIQESIWTIGVNYISMYFRPDYCLIIDKIYPDDTNFEYAQKIKYMTRQNHAMFTFSKYYYPDCPTEWAFIQSLDWKEGGFDEAIRQKKIFAAYTSTISAISLAILMGFEKIGIIGFDIKGHPVMEQYEEEINKICLSILIYCRSKGIQIYNLSMQSKIKTLPKISLGEYLEYYV